jgi:hypothetical protein
MNQKPQPTFPERSDGQHRMRLATFGERLKLAALAVAGVSVVSIPVALALMFSATGAPDVVTIGAGRPQGEPATPAHAVERSRCVASGGYCALTFDDGPSAATTRRLVAAPKDALVRPPGAIDADVRRSGLTVVGWTVDTDDTPASVDAIVRRALGVRAGGERAVKP